MGEHVQELSETYAGYLKIDSSSEIKAIEESIDETLTRLEEFETILLMMRSSAEMQLTTSLLDKKEDLLKICQKVRFLEEIVSRVKHQVDAMETTINAAEAELKNSTQGKLQSLIKPLLFMRSDAASTSSSSRDLKFTPQPILKVDQFFLNK